MRVVPPSVLLATVAFSSAAPSALAQLGVVTTQPALNANNVSRTIVAFVQFDRPVDQTTFTPTNFKVFGKINGPIAGTTSFSPDGRTVYFTPARAYAAGEVLTVMLSKNLKALDGTFIRATGYTYQFTIGVAPSVHRFRQRQVLSNRDTTGAQTRIYGGLACDLNNDGWADLTTVNEVSSDLRVFLNAGVTGSSFSFGPMLTPYTPIPIESSPNEVGDFNGDGFVDAVISSVDDVIAVCMGNGNGTFQTPLVLPVGGYPRGFGVFDFDADGDFDIAVANNATNNVSIRLNNGNGTFAADVKINVTGGPYGMSAADMDNDGIMDLVVGCSSDQTVKVLRGNGNATFTQVSSRPIGGTNWVVTLGDLNNDGRIDVSAANAFSANGSILLGNGNGTLQAAMVMATGGHTVSTDLADLDGDGDLDWVLSSFGAGRWYVYLNNGAGVMTASNDFTAPANPSCAVPMDMDNDGDIDLMLTDEIADVIVMLENYCSVDFNQDGLSPDSGDLDDFIAVLSGGPSACSTGNCDTIDFNNDGLFPDSDDLDAFIRRLSGGVCGG
jgi:hypothetical protein